MSNTSWRHHYIPQFYLKGFTSKEGTFKIFDVNKDRFVKNGKSFSPESYFFESDSNSVITENEKSDFIESAYMYFDSMASEILSKIGRSTSSEKFQVIDSDIAMLQYFIGLMYWRIPSNQEKLENKLENSRFRELGLKIMKENEVIDDIDFEIEINKNPNFVKFMRFLLPSYSYHETIDCKTPMHIVALKEGGPLVCSDNPIICMDPSKFNVYTDDFVFPLNKTRLFIRGDSLNEFAGTIKIYMDMLIFKQAIKYVSCTDDRYLFELDRLYKKFYGSLGQLRETIMKQILY